MGAPEWRLEILAGVKPLLRQLGFSGSRTRFRKTVGHRAFYVQFLGGSDQHDTDKLSMQVLLGVDFADLAGEEFGIEKSAYLTLWSGWLPWQNAQGVREGDWRAYTREEATTVLEGIKKALPEALATMDRKFQTWHDVLVYLDRRVGATFDLPGKVNEFLLPKAVPDQLR
ncbi:MAG TPA: hypothetical protein VEX38_05355 [Fimbriimonadaceae bacterium]|nr:hypothetical protein [Fimbriimonadaceae bacterium]